MQTGFLRVMSLVPPTDVAPPPVVPIAGIAIGGIIGLCCLVVVIGVVAFFVIRGVKKNRSAKESAPAQTPPADVNP